MENNKKSRKPNSTENQKTLLVDFIVQHPELVSGKNTIKSTVKQRQKLWENIANILNSEVGPKKAWNEWRKTWCDLKTNAKSKAGYIRKEINKTGGGEADYSELTEMDRKIIDILGPTVVEGHTSISETPVNIDFSVGLPDDKMFGTENPTPCSTQQDNDLEDVIEDSFGGLDDIRKLSDELENSVAHGSIPLDDLQNTPTVSKSKYLGKKKRELSKTEEASKTLAKISAQRNQTKANYYSTKLKLIERQTLAKEKKADALHLIGQALSAKYNLKQ